MKIAEVKRAGGLAALREGICTRLWQIRNASEKAGHEGFKDLPTQVEEIFRLSREVKSLHRALVKPARKS